MLKNFSKIYLDEVPSTNVYLKDMLVSGKRPEEGTIIITDHQTTGKGQKGNFWESEQGQNLVFSLPLYPGFLPPSHQFALLEIASIAMVETLEYFLKGQNVEVSIKWPNDIYVGDKKICGMLIEHNIIGSLIDYTILGIGLNVNQRKFLSDAPNPISLIHYLGKRSDLTDVLSVWYRYFSTMYMDFENKHRSFEELHALYEKNLYRKIGFYPYKDAQGVFEAEVVGVESNGCIKLKPLKGEPRSYAFKEVSYILSENTKF